MGVTVTEKVATAQPLAMTRAVEDVSVTERNGFKTCRRRWSLEVLKNLEPSGTSQWALVFGTGMHLGLEEYYRHMTLGKGPAAKKREEALEAAKFALREWHDDEDKKLKGQLEGAMYESASGELWQLYLLGCHMFDNYNDFAKMDDTFKVLAIEGQIIKQSPLLKGAKPVYGKAAHPVHHESGRILVPIVDPDTKEPLPGPVYLSGKLDQIVEDTYAGRKGLWVNDHKTTSGSVSDRGLDFDDQITGYCYIMWRLFGILPRGVMFNYLVKREVKQPKILKDGSLSTDKDQGTTPVLYKQAMKKMGLMKGNRITSEKHAGCYEALLSKGWDPFFKRMRPQRSMAELEAFERRLVYEISDMQAVRDDENLAYPHLSSWHCGYCDMAPICNAMEKGEDVDLIKETMFRQAEDRKA